MKTITKCAAMMMFLLLTASCGTFKPVYSETTNGSPDSVFHTMRNGDLVRLKFKDGRITKAYFRSISEQGLTVKMFKSPTKGQQTVSFSDLALVEKWKLQVGKTVGAAVASVVMVFLILEIYLFTTLN